jgi:hypothetical protein
MRAGHTHILTTDHPSRPGELHSRPPATSCPCNRSHGSPRVARAAVLARSRSLDPCPMRHTARALAGVQSFFPFSQSAAAQATLGAHPERFAGADTSVSRGRFLATDLLPSPHTASGTCLLSASEKAWRLLGSLLPAPLPAFSPSRRHRVPLQGFRRRAPSLETHRRARVLRKGKPGRGCFTPTPSFPTDPANTVHSRDPFTIAYVHRVVKLRYHNARASPRRFRGNRFR